MAKYDKKAVFKDSMYLLENFVSDFAPNDVIKCNSGKRSIVSHVMQTSVSPYELFFTKALSWGLVCETSARAYMLTTKSLQVLLQ